ncbi:DUF1542 domain-containing protein, partial [Staphylococcus aureus]|uniref:DUF1542 domain-containing protein n=1 Tax=Staphylococcus aureus TaxID=1280 RepID=UPI00210E47E1
AKQALNGNANVQQAKDEATALINNSDDLNQAQKYALKQQVQTEKTAADAATDAAHSNVEVEAAKDAEIAKIEAIQPATTTKDNAKQANATKANERKTAISQTNSQVNQAATKSVSAIKIIQPETKV